MSNSKYSKDLAGAGAGTSGQRVYVKILATYKCQSANCPRTWRSTHGWVGNLGTTTCDCCGTTAKLTHMVDQYTWFDQFNCGECGEMWTTSHKGDGDAEIKATGLVKTSRAQCPSCNSVVTCAGSQKRFARRYFLKCWNDNCTTKPSWEDFSFGEQFSQRCLARNPATNQPCGNRGDVVEVLELHQERRMTGVKPMKWDPEYHHSADNCDMCFKLQREGKGYICLYLKKVQCSVEERRDGVSVEKVKKTVPVQPGFELVVGREQKKDLPQKKMTPPTKKEELPKKK